MILTPAPDPRPAGWFAAALFVVAALYAQGLSGPFLFDDFWNLAPIEKWIAGEQSWRETMLPDSTSLLASRPVSMASFMLTSWLGGTGPVPFKLGNLIVHLLVGFITWRLLLDLLSRDQRLAAHAPILAAAGAALWLIHPLHVSTVLYSVQRMTQLAAMFTLASLATYMLARTQLQAGRTRSGLLHLFVSTPALVTLGVLAKQNAAMAPLLMLMLELAYLRDANRNRGYPVLFLSVFLAVPALIVCVAFIAQPSLVTDGYRDWNFTLEQRLLTQPRVLLDYIGTILLPYAPAMGLYTDDFVTSTGLLSPVTTLASIVGLVAISAFAIVVRRRAPSVFAGWFFFLAAHGVESSFLPLEMNYEHRNYLPSIGLILATVGLGALVPKSAWRRNPHSRLLAQTALVGFFAVLAFATFGRILVWQHNESIVEQGVRQHPTSQRALFDKASLEIGRQRFDIAREAIQRLVDSPVPGHRVVGNLYLAAIQCLDQKPLDPAFLEAAVKDSRTKITVYEAQMIKLLDRASNANQCRGNIEGRLADAFVKILAAATSQPEKNRNKFVIREISARLYLRAGRWKDAERQAEIAWVNGHNPPAGAMLARIYLRGGQHAKALAMMPLLETRIDARNKIGQAELRQLRALIARQTP